MSGVTKKNITIFIIIVFILIGGAYIYFSTQKMGDDINYIGSCDIANIEINRVTDVNKFLQNKDESIIIYNDRNELKEISDAFITGRINIDYNYHNDDTKYELKFIKKNNEEFTVGLFTPQEIQESKYVTIPFMAFDYGKSTRQELSKVTLIINGTESSSIKLTKLK
ncbi:MAG: hypothetical protein E7C49_19005 [Clostridium sp.]|nr:hypothetical protein [Clostridium sp.]